MREFFYNNQTRLDWGLGNPNVTGSLIAFIMLAAWVLTYLPKKWGKAGFWLAAAANCILIPLLVQTYSRGAWVAAISGLGVMIFFAHRPWPVGRMAAIILAIILTAIYALSGGLVSRFLHGISGADRSVTNRWSIYCRVPRMMWDAPWGWGAGKAGDAYCQWYQPIDNYEEYVTLVNSHATWLVEWPWHLRFLYLGGWLAAFHITLPNKKFHFPPAFAICVAFFVTACFTSVGHYWQAWILPISALFVPLIAFFRSKFEFNVTAIKITAAFIVIGVLLFCWFVAGPSEVSYRDGRVVTEDAHANSTLVIPTVDKSVLGKFYGHNIRRMAKENALRIYVGPGTEKNMEMRFDFCIMAGTALSKGGLAETICMQRSEQWILLNPDLPTPHLGRQLGQPHNCTILSGAFSKGSSTRYWRSYAQKHLGIVTQRMIPGAGRYVAQWQKSIVESMQAQRHE